MVQNPVVEYDADSEEDNVQEEISVVVDAYAVVHPGAVAKLKLVDKLPLAPRQTHLTTGG